MLLNKADIALLIPHGGAMCLLDSVIRWDASGIRCISQSHREQSNPLCSDRQLPAVCGVEYAAQAMAVHGSLAGKFAEKPRSGYLASVRDVKIGRDRLDDLPGSLIVDAEIIMGDGNQVIYQFALFIGDMEILQGRATVVLDAGILRERKT